MKLRIIVALAVGVACSGCGTVIGHVMGKSSGCMSMESLGGVYQGVRVDYGAIKKGEAGGVVFGVVDFPLSFTADTLILPFDALQMMADAKEEKIQ